jgi:hypothetical protein
MAQTKIHQSRDWLFLAVPGLFGLGVYMAMIPAQLTAANFGEDGGDLLAAAMTLGVPHPTGYPSYILLLRLFLGLPFGSSYWKGALFSALAAGLALILLAFYIANQGKTSTRSRMGGIFGVLALAFSPLFWSQAVIIEVQAFQALLTVLMLWWIQILESPRDGKWGTLLLLFLAGCGGLSLGNHLTILFLFPLVIAAEIKAIKGGMPFRWIAWQGVTFLMGCFVVVYLPISARNYPPVNWGNPQSFAGLEWLLSGSLYQNMLFGVSLAQFLERAGNLAKLLWDQFNIGILVAIFGVLYSGYSTRIRQWGLVWIFIAFCTLFLTYNSRDSIVYLVPAWIVVSIWIGDGFSNLLLKISTPSQIEKIVSALLLFSLFIRIPQAWNSVNPSRDRITGEYLGQILEKAPADALIMTISDYDTFPLWYGHFGDGQRSDLRVVVYPLTQFIWYQDTLRHVYPDLIFPMEASTLEWGDELIQLNLDRPVCKSENEDNSHQHIKITCGESLLFEGDFSKNGN